MIERTAKRVIIAVVGGTVLFLGIAMIVLPGPALVFMPLGLAILATEFVWAKKLLKKVRQQAEEMYTAVRSKKPKKNKAVREN